MKAAFFCFILSFELFSQSNGKEPYINNLLDSFYQSKEFNGIVTIIDSSNNIDFYARGYRDFNSKELITNKNKFNVMSLAKAVYLNYYLDTLVKNPELLSKKVNYFLKDFPDSILTVLDLINHKSNINDPINFYFKEERVGLELNTLKKEHSFDYYNEIKNYCFELSKNTIEYKFNYCNANYFILAKVYEVLSGKSFEKISNDFIKYYGFKDIEFNKDVLYYNNNVICPAYKNKNVEYLKKEKDKIIEILSKTIGLNDLYLSIEDITQFHKYFINLDSNKRNLIFNNCMINNDDLDLSICMGMRIVNMSKFNTKLLIIPGSMHGSESFLISDLNKKTSYFAFITNNNSSNFKNLAKYILQSILRRNYIY
jgi:hypothetical protein